MGNKAPTFANTLSSLGVRGAISCVPDGEAPAAYAGFVPVLDESGRLSVKFIPPLAMESVVSPLSNVVVIDPGSSASEETGSVVAPFRTIGAAAAAAKKDDSGRCALLLMPGRYPAAGNSTAQFSDSPAQVYFIGVGECALGATTFNVGGLAYGGAVFLTDVSTDSCIKAVNAATVTLLGRSYVGRLEVGAESHVRLSSEARVESTDSEHVSYLSEASRIGNDSSVPGKNVKEALDRIHGRKIRVLNVNAGDSGFSYDDSSYVDVEASSTGSGDAYDLRRLEKVIVDGINRFVERGKDIKAETVTADTIKAGIVEADKLKIDAMVFGGYKLTIDPYGYLVVADGDTPIEPPSRVILISDSAPSDYAVYAITAVNGRLHMANADMMDSGSSSGDIVTELHVADTATGAEYVVKVVNGHLKLYDEEGNEISIT